MGYMHIDNLYKNQDILLFKQCYALEKIHGTSARISSGLRFFSGGCKHETFVKLFENNSLLQELPIGAIIYGEAFGGKLQGMSETYGPELRFLAFDVKIGNSWLTVPKAEKFCSDYGIGFVSYNLIPTALLDIDAERDRDSEAAIVKGKMREGVVLRPLIEVTKNNGKRIIAKHKRDEFKETKTPRKVTPEELIILADAKAIAEEWVTRRRLEHIINGVENIDFNITIKAMIEDIKREAKGEIIWSNEVSKAIGRATATMIKEVK